MLSLEERLQGDWVEEEAASSFPECFASVVGTRLEHDRHCCLCLGDSQHGECVPICHPLLARCRGTRWRFGGIPVQRGGILIYKDLVQAMSPEWLESLHSFSKPWWKVCACGHYVQGGSGGQRFLVKASRY